MKIFDWVGTIENMWPLIWVDGPIFDTNEHQTATMIIQGQVIREADYLWLFSDEISEKPEIIL